ncbi:ABC transporter substrate-binding protein [Nocardioides mangrovicus]|nr:ABC transporter substrate-binding protein [Nocardioides mangrovicus]
MSRFITRVAVGAAVLATVSACGSSGSSTPPKADLSTSSATSAACAGQPVRGGSVVYARQNETQGLNPLNAANGNGDIFADELLYSPLVRSDPQGGDTIVPALATSWEVSSDGLTYTFHLRDGVTFSNGQALTAEDVKFSLDRFGNPKINTLLSNVAEGYKSTEVVNASTVAVHLTHPVAAFLYNLSIFPAFIVPKNLVEQQGEAFWKHPVGTGPFKLKEFQAGSHITFERNTHYWESGKPYLDSVRFDFATDSSARLLELRNGQAQLADGVLFSQISSVQKDSKLQVQAAKVPLFVGLWLNHQRAPLADLKVRQAMQYALNRKLIDSSIFRGVGTIPNSVLMALEGDAPSSTVKPYSYDLAKAKKLMAESGYPKGFSTTLQYPAGYDYYRQLALLMQSEYAKLGIKLKLVEQPAATVTSNWSKSDYDLTFPFAQFTSDVVVPDEYAQFLAGDPSLGLQGFFSNWSDPSITAMVDSFVTSTDTAAREQLWPKIQQALMDQTPVINVMDLPFVNAHATNVCGTSVNALGVDHLENTWLAR